MPLDMNNLPIAIIYALVFALIIGGIAFVISIIGKLFRKKSVDEPTLGEKIVIKKKRTTGEQLDQVFLTTIFLVFLMAFSILILTPLYAMEKGFNFGDNWPFILIISTITFSLLTFIDWTKIRSKRTPQRDLKRY